MTKTILPDELNPEKDNALALGKYRHYKTGNLYEVIGLALHSETQEEMVIYKALYDCKNFGKSQVWVRAKNMFLGYVTHNEQCVQRFKLIGSDG